MTTEATVGSQGAIFYPDSDGKPIADNTKQFRWIVVIQQNLEWLFADNPDVFVAGDLLWYPIEGNNKICNAPDVLVAFGRPKGDRGSYKQWEENNVAPQVVFEILSPSNRPTEMDKKLLFYDRHGVEEYYLYDPDTNELEGWLRIEGYLDLIESIADYVSPRLGIRFDRSGEELQIYRPDGDRFLSYTEIARRLEQERQRAEQERQRAEQAEERAARLAERLRQAGIDPEQV
ncbi:Uma2 family endonuclease [Kovacikia minuta CCNUW1]|uniref:Uma2 family endonuclease n=1 Tax=Kovacikia minuta TaxID=2931930 RepID=UPI001CCEDE67|nr:Uma2 family endonuclease [Kovacikia minuta]UBF27698.1 Uma2 family endonuclease [Kovacikia minuta CCNUW1]